MASNLFNLNGSRRFWVAGALLLGLSLPFALDSASASRLPNGRVVFNRAPELVGISPIEPAADGPSQLKVVIELPLEVGEPLEALVIRPRDGDSALVFDPSATAAYVGEVGEDATPIPLASVGGIAMDPSEVLIVFETPVEPGNQVTVVLTNQRMPLTESCEIGVTAYPAGDSPVGQFLGYEEVP